MRAPRMAKVLKRETRMVSTSFEKFFKEEEGQMGEFKEIIMFCLMYSSVLLGALAYSFGPVPKAQKVKSHKY